MESKYSIECGILSSVFPIDFFLCFMSCAQDTNNHAQTEQSFTDMMKAASLENNGYIDFSKFGWKVCVAPEGVTHTILMVRPPFSGLSVRSINTDKSEGVWYVAVQHRQTDRFVDALGINQRNIRWAADGNAKISELITCNRRAKLYKSNNAWVLEFL